MTAHQPAIAATSNWDSLMFRVVFALCFIVYLAAAIGLRLTPNYWRGAEPHRSIFSEAWEASGTTAEIAFSG